MTQVHHNHLLCHVTWHQELDMFITMIKCNVPFAYLRFGDGEKHLIEATNDPKLRASLMEALKYADKDYYIGLGFYKHFYTKYVTQDMRFITEARLFTGQYKVLKTELQTILYSPLPKVLIANHGIDKERVDKWNNLSLQFLLQDNAPVYWQDKGDELISSLISKTKKMEHHIFLVSVGPMSEPIIHALWRSNRNNAYIDFGSALDEETKGYPTRLYHKENFPPSDWLTCPRWGVFTYDGGALVKAHPEDVKNNQCTM